MLDQDYRDEDANVKQFFGEVLKGIMSVLTVTSAPLYRYPYRTSAEAFSGDWKRIGSDIESALNEIQVQSDERPVE